MAQISTFLFLKSGGSDVKGESSMGQIAGVDVSAAIECLAYDEAVSVGYEPRSGRPTGDRSYEPIRIVKWVDRSSPELALSATQSKACTAEFKFFRPSDVDAGLEHFFTVTADEARVQRIRRYQVEGDQAAPAKEEIEFVFGKITWKHETENTEHEDSWKNRSAG